MLEYIGGCDSTQAELERKYFDEKAKAGTVLIAGEQQNGTGRFGRSFYSPKGGLYMSMLLDYKPSVDMAVEAALSARTAIEAMFAISCDFKPVNDLYFRGKKICGTIGRAIAEQDMSGKTVYKVCVIGIGVNLFEPEKPWPEDISEKAGSIFSKEESRSFDEEEKKLILSCLAESIADKLQKKFCL